MFYSLTKLSAPVQQVLYQMKIITTAGRATGAFNPENSNKSSNSSNTSSH